MTLPLLALLVILSCTSSFARQAEPDFDTQFATFVDRFHKSYASQDELRMRKMHFQNSLDRIAALTQLELKLGGSAVWGITKFSDLSPEEFEKMYLKAKPSDHFNTMPISRPMAALPAVIDWRNQAPYPLTAVKNQEQCGGCWAFSATEVFESAHVFRGGAKVELSPQQTISCSGSGGCGGGDQTFALFYMNRTGGLMSESAYPYASSGGGPAPPCHFDASRIAVSSLNMSISSHTTPTFAEVQTQLASNRTAAIRVNSKVWQDYVSGVIRFHCDGDYGSGDHSVQLVGYDTVTGPVPFWIVRNSWGTDWGETGYLRIALGADNDVCGVLNDVTIACFSCQI